MSIETFETSDVADDPALPTHLQRILKWEAGDAEPCPADDHVVTEEPLEIRVRGRAIGVTMRTPGHDADLAVGFLLGEGVIRAPGDVLEVAHCPRNEDGNVINLLLAPDVPVDFDSLTRHVFASSSCGLCGTATIEAIHKQFPAIQVDDDSVTSFSASMIAGLPEVMRAAQSAFDRTGGLHAAALFDLSGKLIVLREDVGRHNAVDKVIGHCLRGQMFPLDQCLLLVSGRSSFEIMQKALAGRIPVVAAVSAPSSLAARFARKSGQTLIGFLRGGRMNIYSHPDRLRFST